MTIAVVDADVLFPMLLRDTLLRAAAAGCFRLHWSKRILAEVARNLISDVGMQPDKVVTLIAVMEEAFPDANVVGWEKCESQMSNHPKDRHVVAAAVAVEAKMIVTSNIRDFRHLPSGMIAATPDDFLMLLSKTRPQELAAALEVQAVGYRRPKMSAVELIERLAYIAPQFA